MKKQCVGKAVLAVLPIFAIAASMPSVNSQQVNASNAPAIDAYANGTLHIENHGDNDDGIGFVNFKVEAGFTGVTGRLDFGAEHPHGNSMYPDFVIRMRDIEQAEFNERSIRFSGQGDLHNEPVYVSVHAFDNVELGEADHFGIVCTNAEGEIVYEAHGLLFIGDIRVGESP